MVARVRSRRDEDPLFQRILGALVVSLLAHLSFFGVARLGQQLNWWESRPFQMFRTVRFTTEELAKLEQQQRQLEEQRRQEQPVLFVQVTEPSEEPPPETRYYSSVNSRAANPEPGSQDQVKMDGTQDRSLRLANAPRVATGRPTPPPQPEAPGTADASPETSTATVRAPEPEPVRPPAEVPRLVETKPEPPKLPGIGDLALARPEVLRPPPPLTPPVTPVTPVTPPTRDPAPAPTPTPSPRPRPRTVTEAKLRQSLLAGEMMKQAGGVARKGPVQLDAKGLAFGAYDEALVAAVQNRWFALLDERRFAGGVTGRVVVSFRLHADGSVRNCEATESNVDPLFTALCQRAISDPSPYEKWPSDMQRMIGANVREMRFTFFYN